MIGAHTLSSKPSQLKMMNKGTAATRRHWIGSSKNHICSHAQARRRRSSGSRPGRGRVGHGRTTAGADDHGTDLRFNDNESKRNKHAALKLMRKLLRKYAVVPERMVTD